MGFLDWFNQGYLDAGDNFFSSSDNEPTLIHRLAQRTATNKGVNQSQLPRENLGQVKSRYPSGDQGMEQNQGVSIPTKGAIEDG